MTTTTQLVHESFPELNEERFDLYRDGESIAYATTVDRDHEIWIPEIWVHPGHRGNGVARQLLAAVLRHYPGRAFALAPTPFEWSDHGATEQGLSAGQLESWYARRGFSRDGHGRMVRRGRGS